ncbi:hypothetical protein ALC57_05003, partial [Trachymyrmex cornetzi]
KMQKMIKVLQQKVRRQRKKIQNLTDLLKKLTDKKLLESNALELINHQFGGITVALFESEWKNHNHANTGVRYSKELKNFALTLYYYSPKAYNYCRSL